MKSFIVTAKSIQAAIIQNGENKGLPLALAQLISNGTLTRAEVDKRGWEYGNDSDIGKYNVE